MSALQHFRAPEGLAPGPGFSHAVTGRGRWVAIAGQVALDDADQLVGAGDLEAQARQVFANLSRALAAAGASFADVVKLNYYVTDISQLPVARAVRDEYVDTSRPPGQHRGPGVSAGHARANDRDRGLGHLRRLIPRPRLSLQPGPGRRRCGGAGRWRRRARTRDAWPR